MSSRIEIDLSGNHWKMQRIRPGQGVKEGFHELASEYQGTFFNWNQGCVPGDVYTDLQRAGEIDDPYFGRNFGRAKWVQEYEWWYITKFDTPEELQGKEISVCFEGVDYSCEAWVNGHYLGRHEGMFSHFEFDVTRFVRFEKWSEGCNILMIKLDPPPRNHRPVMGRKFCFGGDYMPDVVPLGIWQPIKVRATGKQRIQKTRIESKVTGDDAVATIQVEATSKTDAPVDVQLSFTLEGENFEGEPITHQTTARLAPGPNTVSVQIPVSQAKLWWPWDMGDQNLYELSIQLTADGEEQDEHKEVFGIREITMSRNPGFTEEEVENDWTFEINGKRHFLRSNCWSGPPSMLYGRNRDEKYDLRLKLVKEANVNNLRIFGWHPPEVPYFYELCDRLGITVWTNFCFATQAYKADPEVLHPAVDECVQIVEQRRNHPSCIMFMGGEEVFFSNAHVESDNKLIMETIGDAVRQVTNIPYAVASPMSGEFGQLLGYKPKESSHANEHYYAAGLLLMEDYYPNLDYCVIPELTAASAPSVESLKKFIPEDELWPMGPSWGYHWADIDILKVLNVEVFGELRCDSLEDFVEATQTAHGIIAQFALEHFRRRKPRVSCVSLCHFMTHMPDIKWGIIDYYGEKKLAFDYVKRAYQPVLVSLEYTKRRWNAGKDFDAGLWVVNDRHEDLPGATLRWTITNPQGEVCLEESMTVDIAADSSVEVKRVNWLVEGETNQNFTVQMQLVSEDGELLCDNWHTLLVGDQEEAKKFCKEMHEKVNASANSYGKSYYRYFPQLWDFE
ncbi:MAG: sugar-binding domain-containing protein [Verrucomicrobiota bacterium]